jgi:CRP-like cAMP-binding protein
VASLGVAPLSANFRSPFLEGFSSAELRVILAAAKHRRYPAQSVMTYQGNPAEHLFLVARGRARYFFITQEGKKILLLWLGPGDVFGGAALVQTPSDYVLSTETVRESHVLVWDRATIRGVAARFPRLLENAISIASEYLTWYMATHVALTTDNARRRLARVLISLAQTIGHPVQGGLEIGVSNEDLANASNLTPFSVSRLMSEWQRSGALLKRRGNFVLRAPERLHLQKV